MRRAGARPVKDRRSAEGETPASQFLPGCAFAPAATVEDFTTSPSVNCRARSRIKNRNRLARSPRSISRFRAC
jgi:hypothetical protein